MSRFELRPFADEYVDAAASLLAARHARHRAAEPLLPARYEDPAAAREELEALWRQDDASGVAAVRGGRLAAYLVGAPAAASWGPNVWVGAAGHAAADAETLRDAYAAVAGGWVDEGRTAHYALVPASDAALVDAWFRLGFGQQHAHGIRSVPRAVEPVSLDGVEIRRARSHDVELCLPLDRLLPEFQQGAPVFSRRHEPPSDDEVRAALADELADESAALIVAVRDSRALGGISVAPVERSGAHAGVARPEQACVLGWAAVMPEARGIGVGVALTNAVFGWARERGYESIVVDWRVTNLVASRFWPARGFRTTFLRLYRSIS